MYRYYNAWQEVTLLTEEPADQSNTSSEEPTNKSSLRQKTLAPSLTFPQSSVADPKLLISDPDPTWRVVTDPDTDLDPIWIRLYGSFGIGILE